MSAHDATPTRGWSADSWALPVADLRSALLDRLDEQGVQRWEAVRQKVRAAPSSLPVRFPGTGRAVGRAHLSGADEQGLLGSVDDLARVLLLVDATQADPGAADLVPGLYRDGDAAERRAVVRALPHLPGAGSAAELVADALRTNDTRLVAAAVGPAAGVLDEASWRQAVLKCLFVGVPLRCVHRLAERCDPILERMAAGFVAERVAAGRDVPPDIGAVLPPTSPALGSAGLADDLQGGHPDRLAAAARARALLTTPATTAQES